MTACNMIKPVNTTTTTRMTATTRPALAFGRVETVVARHVSSLERSLTATPGQRAAGRYR